MSFWKPITPSTQHYPAYVASLPKQEGKTIAITGCTSGTGKVLAQTCGELGARVIMLNRPSQRAEKAKDELLSLGLRAELVPCDLQEYASVRRASAMLKERCPEGIDVLCNNAGVMGISDLATGDGFDVQMQTNHLSHFLLTSGLWPLLEKAAQDRGEARVVNHSSGARRGPALDAAYLRANGGKLGGDGFPGIGRWRRYQQSKLANLLFTYALADHIAAERPDSASKIKCLCAHPGPTDSGLQGKTSTAGGTRLLDRYILWSTLRNAHSTEDGTHGILMAACDPKAQDRDFFGPAGRGKAGPAVLLPAERDQTSEEMLWEESLKAVGLSSFFG
ncbi:MAG: SDR family NAD(P)-dependent oxidoreductase [Myxococcales bacterium]|nr:SDR family NAD(P)-dependent oxidoreductase [Myxococcales bacterium]